MLTSSSSVADHVDAFLAQKRMLGTCSYSSKSVVKTAGARWDNDSKKWYAPNEAALLEMLQTNVWHPECLASGQQMLGVLMKRKEEEQNEAKKKEEAECKRKQEEKSKKKALCDSRDLVIPDSTPEELAELKELGITAEQLDKSTRDPRLGPRNDTSPAERLLMGLKWGLVAPDNIGVYSKRQTQGMARKKHKKLPTLAPFGKTSFSAPMGNGGGPARRVDKFKPAQAPLDDWAAQIVRAENPFKNANMWKQCSLCYCEHLAQFVCECVELKVAFNI